MKKIILVLIAIFINCTVLFSQEIKTIAKGFITITTGQKIEFTNLRHEGNVVIFTNVDTKTKFTYFLNTVKQIEDRAKNIIYAKNKTETEIKKDSLSNANTVNQKMEAQKLEFVNSNTILLNQQKQSPKAIREIIKTNFYSLKQYNSGKTLQGLGNVSLGVGIGLIIGGGLSNMNKADNSTNSAYSIGESNGSPAIIIAGIIVGGIAIPLKISAKKKIRESLELYNQNPTAMLESKDLSLTLIANDKGLGLSFKF